MLKENVNKNWQWFLLWLIALAVALYSRPPIPIDETRYLSVAWEMWQNGDFLVPHINGLPYSHKPPLLFWLIHLSWLIFGVNELSARLVGPAFGLLSIILTIRLARRLWPDQPQIQATVPYVMLGMIIWTLFSSLTMFDTLLTSLVLLCLSSILTASSKETFFRGWIQTGIFLGLGILAKGPVIFIYVLPSILLVPFWNNQRSTSYKAWYLGALSAIFIGAAVALCWAVPAALAGGPDYANAIFLRQTAGRVVNSFAHSRPVYWYLMMSPLLFFPWFFWPPSWKPGSGQLTEPASRFCLAATVIPMMLLSLVSGKQIHYMLPVLPFVSLLIARNAANMTMSGLISRLPAVVILLALSIALFVLPQIPAQGGDREMLAKLPLWLPLVPLISIFPLFITGKSSKASVRAISASVLSLFMLLHLSLARPLQETYSQSRVGSILTEAQLHKHSIAVFPANLSDQFQFAGKLIAPVFPAATFENMLDWAGRHEDGYCLFFTRDEQSVRQRFRKGASVYKNGWLVFAPVNELISDAANTSLATLQ